MKRPIVVHAVQINEEFSENSAIYIQLKQIELEKAKLEKWDGRFPVTFMGGQNPSMLLSVPVVPSK